MGIEDGAIFTDQVRSLGIWQSFHTPYAGYFHLLPRTVAALASALPLAWTAVIYFTAAALIGGICAVVAGRCARGMGLSVPGSVFVAVAVLILPAVGWEVPLLLTNIEWYVIAVFVVFVASLVAGYRPPIGWVVPLLLVGGLTSPLFVVSLPVIVAIAWRSRNRLDLAVVAMVACTAAVQLSVSLVSGKGPGSGHWSVFEIIREYAVRVVVGGALGARLVPRVWDGLGVAGTLVLAVFILGLLVAASMWAGRSSRRVCAYALYASAAYLAVAIVERPHFFAKTLPIGQVVLDHRIELWDGRYMAAPAAVLIVAAVYAAEPLFRRRGAARLAARGAAVLFAAVLVVSFPIDLHHDTFGHWEAQVHAQQQACAQHHGRGSVVVVYGIPTGNPQWKIRLSCRQAFGPTRS